ncbi:Sucrose nonfermenting 4-like protein [Citrus sinensis]|uniref:Sucrose nonfermenting 4-like protein n=1 Tax=Citrus sinensis TaxID=2711 RepID=A0ACB8KKW1_CITSI|nr:Sucrose nonfermenting 4-like protein [Citrus sinensis]
MYNSGLNTGHENSGVVGSILVPVRFIWPNGGRRVSLSGSFTRWSEPMPMSPSEGCPAVFQIICRLPPGHHQYKFYVDGEWRHDENQPHVSGNYGVVNCVYIAVPQPDMVPNTISPETSGNMEVDDVVMRPVLMFVLRETAWCRMINVKTTFREDYLDRTFEGFAQYSEADLQLSRDRISSFLSTHTVYELLPDSGKVTALDVNLAVKQAFHVLYEQGLPMVPLWDDFKGRFVGVLSALDFILILRELGTNGSNLTEEELETHTISAWKVGKLQLNLKRQMDGNGRPCPRPLVQWLWCNIYDSIMQAGPYDSLKEVALKILQNKVATVPIIHSTGPAGSCQEILYLASLSDILKCICRHFKHSSSSLPILQQPVSSIQLGTWVPRIGEANGRPFAMLRPTASLGSALALLVQADVSSIPIVDDNDSLLDIYSRSDITALAKDKAYAQIHLDEMNIHQALQLGQDANPSLGFNGQRCQMCLRSDPLHKVMERLANPGVRRLVIVEAGSKRVEGIISLSDVFRFLLGV